MIAIKQIGRGGFGNVDLVKDENGDLFAKKTFSVNQPGHFPPELVENVKKRFIREASVQKALTHNNIMPIYSSSLDNEPPFFIMPVAESSLSDDIALDKSLHGYGISAIMDILAGLDQLHSIGITHRDLKPQNVLRLKSHNSYRYVISDFGLMSIKDTQLSVLTQTGMRMGSDYYTAPEIVAELKNASPSSDIYSVGCILHDLFMDTVDRIPCNEIHDTGHYADIILCCTRRDPTRRFQSVSDLRDAILSVGQAGIKASEPQTNDFISLLLSNSTIDTQNWERIVNKIERSYPSDDTIILLSRIPLSRINEIVTSTPVMASRLGFIYSGWVKENSFNFDNCDGIANRLAAFFNVNDINCQAEVLLALLFMGTSHNRWYVERKFTDLCKPNMRLDLAKRIAMEIRVLNKKACRAISHLEDSINISRSTLHPVILEALNQVCP